ncbi:MAG: helix-turn-helix domain-containing protein [Nitrospirae bacterium]|nr:helix-turn-helix domain-containing protein [Nitrospirota bacterium]
MEKRTVLLVEDDIVVRDMIGDALKREFKVLEATNCSEAKERIEAPMDLALVDYNLPDGDGFDVVRAVRAVRTGLPVILMTAYSTKDLVIKSLRAGVTDYVEKPIKFTYLLSKIKEILKGERGEALQERAESTIESVMESIAAFIADNCADELTRDKLAGKACMNRYKFSKIFNKQFGQSIKSYLNDARMKKAAELLDNRELSVTDIALSVGYRNIVHFERVFKKMFGTSPARFRHVRAPYPHKRLVSPGEPSETKTFLATAATDQYLK